MLDAHHHLWDPAARDYPWMVGEALAPLRRHVGLEQLADVCARSGIEQTIVVQAVGTLAETEALLALADRSEGLIAGVVGWVPLDPDSIAADIARLRAAPGGQLLVGIRHQAEDEPEPRWLARPHVIAAVEALGELGLVYDVLVRPAQLPAAVELAAATNTTLVLDHCGKPPLAAGDAAALSEWRAQVMALAVHDNVAVKLSGLVTEGDWESCSLDTMVPVAETVLSAFGADRTMFGSDWPVCELAASYDDVVAVAGALIERRSAAERHAILGGTARRIYGV